MIPGRVHRKQDISSRIDRKMTPGHQDGREGEPGRQCC